MSATVNLGFLNRGQIERRSGFMPVGATHIDRYLFSTGTAQELVSISSSGGFTNSAFGLQLFRDTNADGVFNGSDSFVRTEDDSKTDFGDATEGMQVRLTQGNYVATFKAFTVDNISYSARFARAKTGGANPLADPEIPVGNISRDLRKSSKISDLNTADNYAFTLDANSSLDITATEHRNKSGDVNIRVIRDLNNNQVVDRNELVARGISSSNSNIDTISDLRGAGNYILQVCQTQGKSNIGIVFDHSTL